MALKLTIEFVPKPLWGSNPRMAMGNAAWDRVRRKVYADAGYICEICGETGQIDAHEVWEYDDESFIQRLVRLIALCKACHGIKHFARSAAHLSKEEADKLCGHFVIVNGCTLDEFKDHFQTEMAKWKARSAHKEWTLDWGEYSELIDRGATGS